MAWHCPARLVLRVASLSMPDLHFFDSGGDGPLILCLHGFGDHSGMFEPLLHTSLTRSARIVAPDLPGCGASAADADACSIDGQAQRLARFVTGLAPSRPVVLVAHSVASPVAVAMLQHLERGIGVFSIEGNLTSKDAYFSGQASKWDAPSAFHAHLIKGTRNMAHFKPELTRYADALERADATSLWQLGQDAHRLSRNDAFGERYRELAVPSLYYWCRSTTPAPTQAYIAEHGINHREFAQGGHWPTVSEPAQTARAIELFLESIAGTALPL